ncbi:MAG: hypothetical protein GY795_28980 [Desulfobacterales bacterium]|nr:hypothetical protein [Desulfobacterales bacterium]
MRLSSTWEFFSKCKKELGKSTLTKLYQRGERQIDRWSANPKSSDETRKNPLDRYEILLQKLIRNGRKGIAIAAVARQAHIVGCELKDKELPIPDKDTLKDEIIDDTPYIAHYQQVLLDPDSTREDCENALNDLIRESKENYVQKCKEKGWKP